MTDVRLFQTDDGGDISYVNGNPTLADGLETAVFLSLFGGNEQDSGIDADDPLQWWGNRIELDATKKYRSETQYLLRSLPATSSNLRLIEDANGRDLSWLKTDNIADSISVAATFPTVGRLQIIIDIAIGNNIFSYSFFLQWSNPA